MPTFRMVLAAFCLIALSTFIAISTVSQAKQEEAATNAFQKHTTFGVWSKNIFAEAVTVTGPAKTIYLAGMGSEDATSGTSCIRATFWRSADMRMPGSRKSWRRRRLRWRT